MKIIKKVTVEQSRYSHLVCDSCKKKVSVEESEGWFSFNHRHGGWGNDSIDSCENFDVCSSGCFALQLKKSIEEVEEYTEAEVAGMPVEFAKKLLLTLTKNSFTAEDYK